MSSNLPPDGWHEWSRYVLKELERLNAVIQELLASIAELKQEGTRQDERGKAAKEYKLPDRVDALETQMTRMQVKAGIWGAVGAAIPVIASYILSH